MLICLSSFPANLPEGSNSMRRLLEMVRLQFVVFPNRHIFWFIGTCVSSIAAHFVYPMIILGPLIAHVIPDFRVDLAIVCAVSWLFMTMIVQITSYWSPRSWDIENELMAQISHKMLTLTDAQLSDEKLITEFHMLFENVKDVVKNTYSLVLSILKGVIDLAVSSALLFVLTDPHGWFTLVELGVLVFLFMVLFMLKLRYKHGQGDRALASKYYDMARGRAAQFKHNITYRHLIRNAGAKRENSSISDLVAQVKVERGSQWTEIKFRDTLKNSVLWFMQLIVAFLYIVAPLIDQLGFADMTLAKFTLLFYAIQSLTQICVGLMHSVKKVRRSCHANRRIIFYFISSSSKR